VLVTERRQVVNAIILWNTIYMYAVLNQLRAEGFDVRDEDLARLAALAVEDDASQLVTTLAAVELVEDAAAVGFIVDVGEQVERLDDAAKLLQRPSQPRRPIIRLERPHQPASLHQAELQRAGEAQQIVPMLGDTPVVTLCMASLSRPP
jgi:hypothetical protein